MSITFEQIILENREKILNACLKFVRLNYPARTNRPDKCKRDLTYILNSIITCVYDNSTADMHRIVHSFYIAGKLQLKSTKVEKETYQLLKKIILKILKKRGVLPSYGEIVKEVIDVLIYKIDEGYDSSHIDYVDRRNYKLFSQDEIPVELEKRCDLVLQETPMQEPYRKFCILKLTARDTELKKFYCTHLFKNSDGLHMTAMYSAPLVYMVLYAREKDAGQDICAGIHGGTLMSEVLRYGYDFSFVGCKDADINDEFLQESRSRLIERFNINFKNYEDFPRMCFCIGKGIEESPNKKIDHYEDLPYRPLREKSDVRKPPLIVG
jgi:hypothetical protein